jgi:hypothetical protein
VRLFISLSFFSTEAISASAFGFDFYVIGRAFIGRGRSTRSLESRLIGRDRPVVGSRRQATKIDRKRSGGARAFDEYVACDA